MRTFSIYLPLPSEQMPQEYDFVLSKDNGQLTHGRTTLALMPPVSERGAHCVVILPTVCVSWHLVQLPKRIVDSFTGKRPDGALIRSVLAGSMEDQLLDSPENLHFAIFPSKQTGNGDQSLLWVAVCDRAWLVGHLNAIASAGLVTAQVVAQAAPTEGKTNIHFDATLAPAAVTIRSDKGVLRAPLIPSLLELKNFEEAYLTAEPAVVGLAEQVLGREVVPQTHAEMLRAAALSDRNLAQGDLIPTAQARWSKKAAESWAVLLQSPQWRSARRLLLALAILQILALNILAYKESSSLHQLRAQLNGVLLETFPSVPVVVDAPLQMRRELLALAQSRGEASQVPVGPVLSVVALSAPEGSEVSGMSLTSDGLLLKGLLLDDVQWVALEKALQASGFQAQRQQAGILVTKKVAL